MIGDLDAMAASRARATAWWRVGPGVTWIQCREPETAERVRKLKGARLVARGMNCSLRTYEVPHSIAWVEALMTKALKPPSNEAFFSANGLSKGRKGGMVSG